MRKRTRAYASGAVVAAIALVAAACGGGGTTSTSTPSPSPSVSGYQAVNPGTGPPQKGGTLNVLGQGDVDYMDPNISYYSYGYLGQRMWSRNLYSNPAIPGKTTTAAPDLATGPPKVSNDGKTYSVTIRSGVMWDTNPPRQVTAADALLGLKRSCNPAQPFGGLPDFQTLIVGYNSFCNAFAKVSPKVSAIRSYINGHQISGVKVSGQTISYTLAHPASYFPGMLTLPAFSPAPAETLNYVPASAASQQHPISDGPYKVQSYTPARKIVFVRNPVWKASTDPIRKAYVNKIVISETGNEAAIQQQLQTNTAAASMGFDAFPPVGAIPGLISQMQSGVNNNFNLGPSYSLRYLVFNQMSPNNNKALGKTAVRQALSYGINRAHLTQVINPEVNPPLTHILPAGINGAQDVPKGYNPYPYSPSKAKSMLASAGYPNGLSLTLLYRPSAGIYTKIAQALQSDLSKIGVKVKLMGVPDADFYTRYLQVPSVAKRGVWDMALAAWGPDWYGDAALSFFGPLFSGPPSYPPVGSNFGFYNDPATTSVINQAARTGTAAEAGKLWAQADQKVMQGAPVYPITSAQLPLYHASYVHNAVYMPSFEQFDPTNVWLSTPGG